jgi:hypothetical protein
MAKDEDYLANAHRCEDLASRSPDDFCRRALEEIALGWRRLACAEAGQYALCAFSQPLDAPAYAHERVAA